MFTTPTSLKVYARTSIMFQSCGGALVFHYFPGGTLSVRRVLFCFMLATLRFFGRTNEKEKDDRFPGTRARVKREKTRRKEEVPNLFECIEENLPLDSFKAAHKGRNWLRGCGAGLHRAWRVLASPYMVVEQHTF